MNTPPPSVYVGGDSALAAFAASNLSFQAHYTGTTRMGTSVTQGVVDGKLRVFGVKNLMVADIGIEPQATDGNTSYGAYVIGVEAAEILGVDITSTH